TEDGSIEAFLHPTHICRIDRFPSSTEDGSIEARPFSTLRPLASSFPSSTEDGSIEADHRMSYRHTAKFGFMAHPSMVPFH
ncbi:MAG: hypothetical protein ACK5YE_09775, partial [Planctomyces sp.]